MRASLNSDTPRERILADHDRLRMLMKRLETNAIEALRDESRRASIRDALAELRSNLERHLDFEEATLVPYLAGADAWGPARAEHLLKDHVGQRALLVALTEDTNDGARKLEDVAEEILWFVRSFERDMIDEEATFLNAEVLGEEFFVEGRVAG